MAGRRYRAPPPPHTLQDLIHSSANDDEPFSLADDAASSPDHKQDLRKILDTVTNEATQNILNLTAKMKGSAQQSSNPLLPTSIRASSSQLTTSKPELAPLELPHDSSKSSRNTRHLSEAMKQQMTEKYQNLFQKIDGKQVDAPYSAATLSSRRSPHSDRASQFSAATSSRINSGVANDAASSDQSQNSSHSNSLAQFNRIRENNADVSAIAPATPIQPPQNPATLNLPTSSTPNTSTSASAKHPLWTFGRRLRGKKSLDFDKLSSGTDAASFKVAAVPSAHRRRGSSADLTGVGLTESAKIHSRSLTPSFLPEQRSEETPPHSTAPLDSSLMSFLAPLPPSTSSFSSPRHSLSASISLGRLSQKSDPIPASEKRVRMASHNSGLVLFRNKTESTESGEVVKLETVSGDQKIDIQQHVPTLDSLASGPTVTAPISKKKLRFLSERLRVSVHQSPPATDHSTPDVTTSHAFTSSTDHDMLTPTSTIPDDHSKHYSTIHRKLFRKTDESKKGDSSLPRRPSHFQNVQCQKNLNDYLKSLNRTRRAKPFRIDGAALFYPMDAYMLHYESICSQTPTLELSLTELMKPDPSDPTRLTDSFLNNTISLMLQHLDSQKEQLLGLQQECTALDSAYQRITQHIHSTITSLEQMVVHPIHTELFPRIQIIEVELLRVKNGSTLSTEIGYALLAFLLNLVAALYWLLSIMFRFRSKKQVATLFDSSTRRKNAGVVHG